MISICYTLKNRAELLEQALEQLIFQDYNMKDVEICITDGGSTDNILQVIEKFRPIFYGIKYNIADRSKLPFAIPSNNPAADRNAQLCYQPSFEKVIMTDPEVRFTSNQELHNIDKMLDEVECLFYPAIFIQEPCDTSDWRNKMVSVPTNVKRFEYRGTSALCIGVRRSTFIETKGFDIRYALGFACEDSYFLDWMKRNRTCRMMPNWVIHLWHPTQWTEENNKLRAEYSLPLYRRMLACNESPNSHITDDSWKCIEMIQEAE